MEEQPLGAGEVVMKWVMPSVGAVLAVALALSSLPAVRAVTVAKELGSLNVLPFPLLFLNAVGWLIYSSVIRNLFVFLPNIVGTVCALYFTLVGYEFAPDKTRFYMRMILLIFTISTSLVTAGAVFLTEDLEVRKLIYGLHVNFILILFYSAPLSEMRQVLRTKDASSFSIPLATTTIINGSCWFIYGLVLGDPFIYVPNGLGAFNACVQMVFIAMYWKNRKMDPRKPSTVGHTKSWQLLLSKSDQQYEQAFDLTDEESL